MPFYVYNFGVHTVALFEFCEADEAAFLFVGLLPLRLFGFSSFSVDLSSTQGMPQVLGFAQELQHVSAAVQIRLRNVRDDVRTIEAEVEKLKQEAERQRSERDAFVKNKSSTGAETAAILPSPCLPPHTLPSSIRNKKEEVTMNVDSTAIVGSKRHLITRFATTISDQVSNMRSKLSSAEEKYADVLTHFGEDEVEVCDFFLTIFQFMKDFDKAVGEIDRLSEKKKQNQNQVDANATRRGSLKEELQKVRNAVEPGEGL